MSSAICFNLDQSRILSSGNGLNQTNDKLLDTWYVFFFFCVRKDGKNTTHLSASP